MSKGTQVEGFCMDLLSEVAKKLGFKYKVHLVKDGSYGRQDESGNWNGMIGEVMRGVSTWKLTFGQLNCSWITQLASVTHNQSKISQYCMWCEECLPSGCCNWNLLSFHKASIYSLQEADLAIAPLTLTAAREKVVAMTKPFMQTGISILLRRDISEEPGFFDFLAPFTAETWVGILIAYMGTSACIFVVARLGHKFLSDNIHYFQRMIISSYWDVSDLNDTCLAIPLSPIMSVFLCKCRLSPCEWSQPLSEQNTFSFLHSLWYTAGSLTLQGKEPKHTLHPSR